MSETNRSYVLISPCRDESEYMTRTIESVVSQTVKPSLWVIVDDGSTDGSPEILADYAAQYSFIKVITRRNRGYRNVGPGVVDAFYCGYEEINPGAYQYLCKLDLDLELPPKYFETLIERMESNRRLGTCSGKPYNLIGGKYISERRGDEMSVGMTKFFRTKCFQQIGGFVREVMWDAIDCHKCRQLGWKARSWDHPDLNFLHLRVMGSSQHGVITGRQRHGYGQYFMGTGIVYMFATCLFRAVEYPLLAGGAAMFWGYLRAMFQRKRRYADAELIKQIREYQWHALFFGKRRARNHMEKKNLLSWNPEDTSIGSQHLLKNQQLKLDS
ncbi:glycosyltransferase family 2 protein [uncultured Microbulbifer sp.]|uniref:glycosyltransferase family 2 protein n=1 Tax=uncultured Microbulbifer sp. TaxID=348147 RepID=UPI0026160F09|nr:glycosyltransferase family 2 protein [uncultured Microbulbifer sp.]